MLRSQNATFIRNSYFIPKIMDFSIIKKIEPFPVMQTPQITFQHRQSRFFTQFSKISQFEELIKSADSGDANKQYEVGNRYLSANSPVHDNEKGVYYIKLAADNGHPIASYMYGMFLKKGFQMKIDLPQSEKYLIFAADNGNVDAQFELGLEYYLGKSFSQNDEKSLHYLCLAAENKNTIACETVGSFYMNGIGCDPSIEKATKYLKIGSDLGSAPCKYLLSICIENSQPDERLTLLKQAADLGYDQAQFDYGVKLFAQDNHKKEAEKYFRMAANQNHPTAAYAMSQILGRSDNPIKRREGFNFLQKAANYRDPDAMLRYGKLLCGEYDSLFGSVSKIDRKTALIYLKTAADLPDSNPAAMVEYAKQLYLQSKQESSNSQDKEIGHYFMEGINKSILTRSQSAEIIIPFVQFLVEKKRIEAAASILKLGEKLQDASLYYWSAYCGVDKVNNMKLALCASFAKVRSQDVELESLFNMNTELHLTENDVFPFFNTPEDEKRYFNDIKKMYTNDPDDYLAKFKYAMLLFSGIGTDLNVVECMRVLESFFEAKPTDDINRGIRTLALKLYSQWILTNVDDNEKEFQVADLPMKICKEIADAKDVDCQFLYGWKKVFGSCFVVADKDEGMRYLEQAAKSGHANAGFFIKIIEEDYI